MSEMNPPLGEAAAKEVIKQYAWQLRDVDIWLGEYDAATNQWRDQQRIHEPCYLLPLVQNKPVPDRTSLAAGGEMLDMNRSLAGLFPSIAEKDDITAHDGSYGLVKIPPSESGQDYFYVRKRLVDSAKLNDVFTAQVQARVV